MHRSFPGVRTVRFGVGDEKLHVLVEGTASVAEILEGGTLAITFPGPTAFRYTVHGHGDGLRLVRTEQTRMGWVPRPTAALAAARDVLELSVPLSELRPDPHRSVPFHVTVEHGGMEIERHPELGPIELPLEGVTRD